MRRLVAGCAAACVVAGPADAYQVGRGAPPVAQVDERAEACFDVIANDHVYAVASAEGVVTAVPLSNPPKAVLGGDRGAPPTHVVNDPAEPAWGTEFEVCAGGVGGRVTSGRVVYTLHVHGPQNDHAVVLVCTFSSEAAPACV